MRALPLLSLLLALLLAWAWWEAGREVVLPREVVAAPLMPSDPGPRRRAEPTPAPAAGVATPDGPTRFVRRLQAGVTFRALYAALGEGAPTPEIHRTLGPLLPFVLVADGIEKKTSYTTGALLGLLAEPRRDLDALRRLDGPAATVRVWTLGDAYPPDEIAAAERLVGQMAAVADTGTTAGFDVLATPRLGSEIFPRRPVPAWAAGVYFRTDDYSVVRLDLSPWFRPAVLRHELVHAFTIRDVGLRHPRFVTEGLAEYLRHLAPGDAGLRVARAAFAHDFAALVELLARFERAGLPIERLNPARLVAYPPWKFYRLRWLTYPLAQAAVAYVGGEVVEEAFRARSTEPIAAAIRRIRWKSFRAFLGKGAAGGDPSQAVTVADVYPAPEAERGKRPSVREALREIGIDAPEAVVAALGSRTFRDPGRVADVIRSLTAPGTGRLLVLTDLSEAMDRPVETGRWPEARFEPLGAYELTAATPREFAGKLVWALRRQVGARVEAYSLGRRLRTALEPPFADVEPLNPRALPLPPTRGEGLVLCIGSDADLSERAWERSLTHYRRVVEKYRATPPAVLIVDFSARGDLAAWLASLYPDALVAIWDPRGS